MPANVDAMVREGVNAFKEGKKDEARAFLMKAVEIDQYHEQAWLWLSAVVDTPEDQRTCLENVLAINPHNERARAGLQLLTQPLSSAGAAPAPAAPADSGFVPTSVEWGVPAASPPAAPSADQPSPSEYDSWLTNLNLPPSGAGTLTPPPAPAAPLPAAPAVPEPSPFGGFNLSGAAPAADSSASPLTDGPFSTADFEDVFTPPILSAAPAMVAPRPDARPAGAVLSPGAERSPAPASGRSTPVVVADDEDEDDDEVFDEVALSEMDADAVFQLIPPEIKPTRLPGTRERTSPLAMVLLALLALLNVAAAALLAYRLLSA